MCGWKEYFMDYRKTILTARERVLFDPSNKNHIKDYAKFIKHNNWKDGCNYLLEEPYYDIPTMIHDKIVKHYLAPFMGN